MSASALIEFTELDHQYDANKVFSNASWRIEQGQGLLLQGENGSGKTTLAKILCGLQTPSAGLYVVDGVTTSVYPKVKRQLQTQSVYLHQQPFLFDTTVAKNLAYATHRADELSARHRTKIIADLSINDMLDANAAKLSIGQKQRVAIARSLLYQPKFLVLDEPFTAIDKASLDSVVQALQYYRQQGGTLLIISHQHDSEFVLIDQAWRIEQRGLTRCV